MKTAAMFPIVDVDDVALAFGASDMTAMLPPYTDIPTQFKRHDGTKWNRLAQDWFFSGVKGLQLKPRPGVDEKKALRHISAILRSFEPKHEHKEAGVAFLLDQWFTDGTWQRAK
jgi:hypothetical protein